MFAIFKTGGKQLKATVGDKLYIEKIEAEEGDVFTFTDVLMVNGNIGTPFIKGAGVRGKIIKHDKDKKIKVVRYHPKKNVNKIYGHRQPYTLIEIIEILESGVSQGGVSKSSSTKVPSKAPTASAAKPKAATATTEPKPKPVEKPAVEPKETTEE